MFKPVSSKVSFPEVENQILAFWKEKNILQKTNEVRQDGPEFVLYDGPPTVNGNPGIHHVLSRIYKDVIPRYKTMKGYRIFRKAGWDTHGLPVELEIEKELKFTNKAQIEEYGIAKFNVKCRESVLRYLKKWEELTDRIGFWLDMESPYVTFHTGYVESCWWIIKQLWDRGLVYQGYRVTPHCPRCGTSLSSHEVALGYKDAEDPSIYIRFRLSRDAQNPNVALALPVIAYLARLTRGSLLEVVRAPWIRAARARGLPERIVVARHALPAALLPVVSFLGPAAASVLAGSLVVETIFGLPGMGRHLVQGALNRGYTLVMGMVIFYATLMIALNLLVDLVHAWLDPRIRREPRP